MKKIDLTSVVVYGFISVAILTLVVILTFGYIGIGSNQPKVSTKAESVINMDDPKAWYKHIAEADEYRCENGIYKFYKDGKISFGISALQLQAEFGGLNDIAEIKEAIKRSAKPKAWYEYIAEADEYRCENGIYKFYEDGKVTFAISAIQLQAKFGGLNDIAEIKEAIKKYKAEYEAHKRELEKRKMGANYITVK